MTLRSPAAALLALLSLCAAPARALVDLPTSERRALDVVDLACGSGLAPPADAAVLPLDDRAYLGAYRALKGRGLVDPLGEALAAAHDARAEGRPFVGALVPRLEVRAYSLRGAEERLLDHTSGDVLHRGFNAFLSGAGEASWGRWLGGGYEVRLRESPGDFDAEVKRLYLKTGLGKWSFKVGRDAVRLGPGYHGSLVLDDNARPLDLWQVRTEEPLFLPGFLSHVGGFRFVLFNAYLSDEHPEPPDPRYGGGVDPVEDARLLGMRLSYHPASWVDLGLSRAAMYGGKGRETYDTPKDWWELFSGTHENVHGEESRRYDNDQYAALDVTFRLPFLRNLGPLKAGRVYWEYAGTDILANWKDDSGTGNWEPFNFNDVANLGGLYLSTGSTDLRVEFAETSAPWYRNGRYPQGYSYRGLPLGHAMGGDARDLFVQLAGYVTPKARIVASLDVQDRGRSLPDPEKRLEGALGAEAYRLKVFGVPMQGALDFRWARVENALDDPAREDRREWTLGAAIRTSL